MTIAISILSVLLIAEFVMAPINLWTGRTMPLFTRFTGFSPKTARHLFAPLKLAGAVMIGIGIALPALGLVGATALTIICLVYLVRLSAPSRRDRSGIVAFALFGAWAVGLLVLQLLRLH